MSKKLERYSDSKKMMSRQNYETTTILGRKKIRVEKKFCVEKKFLIEKNSDLKKIRVEKKIVAKKILDRIKF